MTSTDTNIVSFLQETAQRVPDRTALITPQGASVSFADLWDRVCRVSAGLRHAGLQPGERMVVMIPMSVDLYAVLLGVIKLGGIAVFVDPWMPMRRIARFAAFAEPAGFAGLGKAHVLRLFDSELRTLQISVTTGSRIGRFPARLTLADLLRTVPDPEVWQPESPESPALITFTSGSSGTPKGANRTHGFLIAQYAALRREFQYEPTDVDMPMFPVFALRNLADGIPSVIPNMDFRRVAEVNGPSLLAQIARYGVRTCTASPPFVEQLARAAATGDGKPELRRILTGGAPVSDQMLRRWQTTFPDTEITVVYGSTEAEPVASMSLRERLSVQNKGYCTGNPVEDIAVRIVRIVRGPLTFQSWEEQECPAGTIGELIVSGDHICRGYFRNPAAEAENKIIGGDGTLWHRMGDTGYLDNLGRFWLTGRVHSTILCKEEPLHAQLVEAQVADLAPEIERTAALEHDGRLVIVVQGAPVPGLLKRLRSAGVPADTLVFTKKRLPLDPRHQAKIDYDALRHQLDRQQAKRG